MPITLNHYSLEKFCWGNKWVIEDEKLLVDMVAKILIGYQHHVIKILKGVGIANGMNVSQNAINDAINKLTITPGADPFHRDGLIFQIFSWIAANKLADDYALIAMPHLIPAQKGFDGLQIKLDSSTKEVEAVIIFEDKATDNPRHTVKTKVWPEFVRFEAGERESELMQQTVGLLSSRPDLISNIDDAIEKIVWEKIRYYRVAITGSDQHLVDNGIKSLFKDYETVICGEENHKRQAEIIHIPELRAWLDNFSKEVVIKLNSLGAKNV